MVEEVIKMSIAYRIDAGSLLKQFVWWLFFLICALYGVFAFYMGGIGILSLLGISEDAPHRATPFVFIVHALSGGVAVITGSLQLNRRILNKKRKMHRVIGRTYVLGVWISSVGGLWMTAFFDVNIAAKIVFGAVSILWFGTTTITFLHILNRNFEEHREWVIRSFSLSFFIVTFSLWVPGLASTNLPEAIGYPLAVFLSWSINLIVAELWIRRTRSQFVGFH